MGDVSKNKQQKSKIVHPRGCIISLVVAILAVGLCAASFYKYVLGDIFDIQKDSYIYVRPSSNIDDVVTQINKYTSVPFENLFKRLCNIKKYTPQNKPGRYNLKGIKSTNNLINLLRSGEQDPLSFTFTNCRKIDEVCGLAAVNFDLDSAQLMSLLQDSVYISKLGFCRETLPAMFLPNTYEMYWNTSPNQFVQRMNREFVTFWNKQRTSLAEAQGLTPIQVATLASIIQEESSNLSEYPIIAGVYLNRLKRGMKLDADPTLKFIANDMTIRRVLDKHKKIDSPYNTYIYAGLPPGPIRIPSIQAIEAVLKPISHSYLYFCAKPDFSGTHNFSKTLSEHNRNAQAYRKALQQRKIFK